MEILHNCFSPFRGITSKNPPPCQELAESPAIHHCVLPAPQPMACPRQLPQRQPHLRQVAYPKRHSLHVWDVQTTRASRHPAWIPFQPVHRILAGD